MKVRLLQTALSLSLAGVVGLVGCDGGDDGTDDITNPPPDSGIIPDTGTTETDSGMMMQPDAGFPDTGPADTGPDPCPDGEEGCECASTLQPEDMAFKQDDCGQDLLCIPWDVVAGQQDSVTGPVHSCIRPCTADADCGAGRFCKDFGFTEESLAARFCVDEVAEVDQFCGGSRLSTPKLMGDEGLVQYETAGTMVGCEEGVNCTRFSDVHPDEGICLNICEEQADCGGATPYCNPIFQSQTSTVVQGVCSPAALGPGELCGTTDTGKAGLTSLCDNADDSPVRLARGGCFARNLYGGLGVCGQFCGSANPCEGSDETGPFVCNIIDPADAMFGGFCDSQCTNFPENCTADGREDLGRMCNDGLAFGTPDGGSVGITFCMDRTGPALAPTVLTPDGMAIGVQGDNCSDPADDLAPLKCPEASTCLVLQQGQGVCLTGCVRSATTAAGPQGGCETVSQTSTCTPNLDMMGNELPISFCGDM